MCFPGMTQATHEIHTLLPGIQVVVIDMAKRERKNLLRRLAQFGSESNF